MIEICNYLIIRGHNIHIDSLNAKGCVSVSVTSCHNFSAVTDLNIETFKRFQAARAVTLI